VQLAPQIPTFIFTGSQLRPTSPECLPRWALPILEVPDHPDDLNRGRAIQVESYGGREEGLDVWRCRDIWVAIYWLGNQLIAIAIIKGTRNFQEFEKWALPAAALMMTSDAQ
jgi:hypothetical protein